MPSHTALPPALVQTLRQVLRVPVAPFAERWLREGIVARFRRSQVIRHRVDRYGNLLLQYRPRGRARAQLAFHAHMDHPGFLFQERTRPGRGRAEVAGQVPPRVQGAAVRFFPSLDSRGVRAEITRAVRRKGRVVGVHLRLEGTLPQGTPGLFDFPALRVRGRRLQSRGHDDTLGTGVLVHLLETARRRRFPQPFDVLLTRAEEAGLVGTHAIVRDGSLPLPSRLVTVEMPRASGDVRAGDGVICRVGDAVCAYDQKLLVHVDAYARACAAEDPAFRFQRRLAWAGRTEASAFAFSGYCTAALCLATVHGHNIGPDGRPAPEEVDAGDLRSLVLLLERLAGVPGCPSESWRRLGRSCAQRAGAQIPRLLDGAT